MTLQNSVETRADELANSLLTPNDPSFVSSWSQILESMGTDKSRHHAGTFNTANGIETDIVMECALRKVIGHLKEIKRTPALPIDRDLLSLYHGEIIDRIERVMPYKSYCFEAFQ